MTYFNKDENRGWSKTQIKKVIKEEHPGWDDSRCLELASAIYRELNRANKALYDNNKRHFERTIPFSFNPLLEEEKFGEFRKQEEYITYYKDAIHEKVIRLMRKEMDEEERGK